MKLKKFNTAVAVMVITGVVAIGSLFSNHVSKPLASQVDPTQAISTLANAAETIKDGLSFSAKDQKVTEIQWRSYKGQIPGKVTLKKWESGDRVYYQMTGPVNSDYIKTMDYSKGPQNWGQTTEMEVYFSRGDGRYDQWAINPKESHILHFDGYRNFRSSSVLPESRYTCDWDGKNITVTFWCHKDDTPGNIVFNYNFEGNYNTFGWATMGLEGAKWDHHDMGRWTHP